MASARMSSLPWGLTASLILHAAPQRDDGPLRLRFSGFGLHEVRCRNGGSSAMIFSVRKAGLQDFFALCRRCAQDMREPMPSRRCTAWRIASAREGSEPLCNKSSWRRCARPIALTGEFASQKFEASGQTSNKPSIAGRDLDLLNTVRSFANRGSRCSRREIALRCSNNCVPEILRRQSLTPMMFSESLILNNNTKHVPLSPRLKLAERRID